MPAAVKRAGWRVLRVAGAVAFLILLNGVVLGAAWHLLRGVVILDPWADWTASQIVRTVPAKFGAVTRVAYGSNANILDASGFVREFCGGVAFRITDDIAAAIEAEGVVWLQSAQRGRAPKEEFGNTVPWNRTEDAVLWGGWKPGPVPAAWMSEGELGWGLGCLAKADRRLDPGPVIEAARKPGAYYTTRGWENRMLLVLPLRLLIVTYER